MVMKWIIEYYILFYILFLYYVCSIYIKLVNAKDITDGAAKCYAYYRKTNFSNIGLLGFINYN